MKDYFKYGYERYSDNFSSPHGYLIRIRNYPDYGKIGYNFSNSILDQLLDGIKVI